MLREILERKTVPINYPEGVYIAVDMTEESSSLLIQYMNDYLPGIKPVDGFHCTIIFSKKPMKGLIQTEEYQTEATFKHFSKFGEDKEVLVAEITSPYLSQRNKILTDRYNFISDFEEYKIHFSLSYEAKDVNLASLPPIDFPITFENETAEQLDTDYI